MTRRGILRSRPRPLLLDGSATGTRTTRNSPSSNSRRSRTTWFSMKLCSGLILSTVLCWAASSAAAQVFDPAKVGAPLSGALAELYLPARTAPVGAVVVLHGCDGIEPHYRQWAQRLADWGYAALLIDSFGPRGFQEVCNRGLLVPPEAQARDAFDGAAYLRAAPQVHAQRVRGDRLLAWRVGGAEGSACRARPPAERTGFRRRRRLLPRL